MGGNRLAERKSVWLGENQCGRGNRFSRAEIIWRGGKSVWLGEIGLAGRKSFGGVGNRCGRGGIPLAGRNRFGGGIHLAGVLEEMQCTADIIFVCSHESFLTCLNCSPQDEGFSYITSTVIC